MNVYGFDDTGPYRGDILVTQIDAHDLNFGMEAIAHDLGWEFCSTAFSLARAELIKAIKNINADPDLIRAVRDCKASYAQRVGD